MDEKQAMGLNKRHGMWIAGAIALSLTAAVLLAWWATARTDRDMRTALLQRTRLVAQVVDIERVQALTGTEADRNSPDYLRLKEKLSAVCSAAPQCRFVYLLGRKPDGRVFFFVDDQPVGHKDEASAGRIYDDVPDGIRSVFETGKAKTAGPYTDSWGAFISGAVPLLDPATGAVAAVMAMDIDARAWTWDVAARSALPLGLMLVLLVGGITALAVTRRVDASPKPVLRRLLPPIAAMVVLLMAGAGAFLWQQHQRHRVEAVANRASEVSGDLRATLEQQASGLTVVLQTIAGDAKVQKALREGDAERLLADWGPAFDTMREESRLTRFFFFDRNRVCLLRVHDPEKRGDRIDRFTALEAERTGATASGIELGSLGTFTLRVVRPVSEGDTLVGYVELGKEIGDVMRAMHIRSGFQAAVVIRKDQLERRKWEEGMRVLGREADWDRLSRNVVVYSSQGRLPDAFAPTADRDPAGAPAHGEMGRKYHFGGKDWSVSATPLRDASGKEVGSLLVMSDITAEEAVFTRMLTLVGVSGGVLLALLLGFVLVLLHRTDAGIRAQHAELRKSEAFLGMLLETVPIPVFYKDREGRFLSFNKSFESLFGKNREEMIGRNVFDINPPEFAEIYHAADEKLFANPGVQIYESWMMDSHGVLHEVVFHKAAVTDTRGAATGLVGAVLDITERKLAEKVLAETKQEFEYIFDNSYVGIMLMRNGRILARCNKRMAEILGYGSPEEMVGMSTRYFHLDEERYKEFGEKYLSKLAQAEQFQVEYQLRRRDGSPVWCTLSGKAMDPSNLDRGVIWVIDDLENRKRAEKALQESEARLRIITDSAQDAILMMDANGLISYWNPAAERILGYTGAEAIGRNLHALLVPPRYLGAHQAAFPLFQQTGHGAAVGKTLDLEARRKDGQDISIQLSLSAIQLLGAWHAVGILRDITEQKRVEAELLETNRHLEETTALANQLAAEAEQASIAKSEFLANMSHEIRTPMNGVIGMAGLLLDTELNGEQRRYAEIVRTSGESLLGLINDILDFSKIEAMKLELEALDFDLTSLLEDLVATLAVNAHEKGIELFCAADPRVPTLLRGDPGRLRQILNNLAGNAVKFTSAGEVAVRVSLLDENEAGILLRFSVRDTGIGIPGDKLGLVFDKFSQVDASTTRQYGGTGLGLAISKQLVALMGGEIGAKSEEGKGSEFWFTARLGRQPEGAQSESIPPADLAGVRALIVDDNATNREFLTARLASWGMRPSEAQDGPGALQALHRALDANDPFRIAVIDMQMPGMDGKTLGRAIKADGRLADLRMVMLTSLGARGDARRFQEIGFAAYATKPIRHMELKAVLSLALTDRAGTEPMPRPIATRHMARETLNRFSGRTARILLAEDNITNQQVAQGILKRLGLSADAVANGAEAVEALGAIPYDLVLMDVQMPVMDGLEATRVIRDPLSAVRNHRIPVIAMTAYAIRGDRENCLEAGMNDYVSKPVSPQSLAEVLEKWLPRETADAARQTPGMIEGSASVAAGEQDAPVFDRAGMMTRLMDDGDLARTVTDGFLADIPRQIEALHGHLEAGNALECERQAHTIKGASASVGGERLRGEAHGIEKAAHAGDLDAVKARMAGLETEFDRLRREMIKAL